MYQFVLNGQPATVAADKNLLDYLRDDARMISVKDGCKEGVCGTCSVLVDGKAVRACTTTVAKIQGKSIVTCEGISEQEKHIYSWAFGKVGSVQCGFCMPGILVSAKSLLDANLHPTTAEVRHTLRSNLCRCTGYLVIERAIDLAAQALRGEVAPDSTGDSGRVGARSVRVDSRAKLLGTGEFVDDMVVPGMLIGATLRSKYPRALVRKIDISAAKALPGVELVLTAKDVPGEQLLGHIVHDWPVMIAEGEETRYVGDALAILAATSKEIAEKAIGLIKVDYEERVPVLSPSDALAEGAPQLHPKGNALSRTEVKRGNVDRAIAEAAHVVTHRYFAPRQEHAFLEPESALVVPNGPDAITVYSGSQSVYDDHREIVRMLGVAEDKVRVIGKYIGGGFGGKEDLSVQHHAALLAWHSGKPVKITLSREESFRTHPKRHPMEMDYTTACDKDGKITAVRARIVADTGAYASLGGPVLQRACTHGAGPYQIDNVDIEGVAVYTNNVPSGAFRGFGVTQTCFAMESNLNLLAEKVGISQWEIRWRNAIEPGGVLSNGQIADQSTALKETLLAVKPTIDAHPRAGIACSFKNTGKGVGVKDIGRVKLQVRNGRIILCTSAACMGQGLSTVVLQIVSETTGIAKEWIDIHEPDTMVTPDSGTSTASRQTFITGEAARRSALALKDALAARTLAELDGRDFHGEFEAITDPITSPKPNRVSHLAYGFATQVVVLNDEGKIAKVVAAHDVGRAINPNGVEGQIEGGVVMGIGYALTEDFTVKDGVPAVTLGTLGLIRSTQTPEIECHIVEKSTSELAYGAKGVGEIVMLTTAPAIACAYFQRDGIHRTSLPLEATPYSRKRAANPEHLRQSHNERAASQAAN
jgi:selenium-dependent xanthine dehydrogenase